MDFPSGFITRLEASARQTIADPAAARKLAMAPGGRATTRRLLLASIEGDGSDAIAEAESLDEQVLAAAAGIAPVPDPPEGVPPIQARHPNDVIELWTERELILIHAGWRLPTWRAAAESSARWMIDEIQPDNATNLPWGVHVFAVLAERDGVGPAGMYAETLLHNCIVMGGGRPDPLSALILLDAAAQLRRDQAG